MKPHFLALATILCTCTAITPVFAASAKKTTDTTLWPWTNAPVVVVTPTKSDRDVNKVPYAVTVINKRDVQKRQSISMDDLLRDVPNFDSAGGPVRVTEEPTLRGLSDRRLVLKVDGIRRNFRGQYGGRYFIDPWLVNHVEVVRGANSAIDGAGAVAGVIHMFTPNATDELIGSEKTWGGETRVGFQGVNNEIATMGQAYATADKFDVLGAVTYRDTDNLYAGDHTEINPMNSQPFNGLVKAGVNLGEKHRAELRIGRYYDDSELGSSPFQPLSTPGNRYTYRDSSVTDYSFNYRLGAGEGSRFKDLFDLTTVIYRSEYNINSRNRSGAGVLRYDQTFFTTNGTDTYNTANVEALGLKHKITTGVEYFENEQSGTRNGVSRSSIGQGSDKNLGIYGQEEVTLFERLTLTPAIRFDQYNLKPVAGSLAQQSRQQWSPKIGADYQLSDVWSFYGSVGKAFRTPTLVELYSEDTTGASGVFITPNPDLNPETALNKEIGMRFNKNDVIATQDNLGFKFSAFNNKIDDYIEQVVTGGGFGPPTATYRNTPQADLTGLELEANYKVGKYGAKLVAGGVRGDNQTAGQPLVDVPADRASLSLERYNFDYQFTTGARVNVMAAQDRVPTGQLLIVSSPAATTFDVYASYTPNDPRLQGMRLDMGVDNVFDKNYRRQLAFIPEAGRNVKATMSWKF